MPRHCNDNVTKIVLRNMDDKIPFCLPHPQVCLSSTHYSDVIMGVMAFQLTSLRIVYSTVYLGADQRKHQISASLAFVRGIHQWPMNSPHKGPVTRKMFPFDDVIMNTNCDKTTCYIKYIKLVVQATYEEPFYTQTDKYVSYCRVIRLWRYYVQIAQDMA